MNDSGIRIQLEVCDGQSWRQGRWRTPDERAQPCEKLFDRKRFRQVIVSTRIETVHSIIQTGSRGQHQNGCVATVFPPPSTDIDPAHVRQIEIQDNHVVLVDRKRLERLTAGAEYVRCPRCLADRPDQQVSDFGIVFNDEYAHFVSRISSNNNNDLMSFR